MGHPVTGWQVLGWAGIASLSTVIVGVGLSFARIFWQAADNRRPGHSIITRSKS